MLNFHYFYSGQRYTYKKEPPPPPKESCSHLHLVQHYQTKVENIHLHLMCSRSFSTLFPTVYIWSCSLKMPAAVNWQCFIPFILSGYRWCSCPATEAIKSDIHGRRTLNILYTYILVMSYFFPLVTIRWFRNLRVLTTVNDDIFR